MEYIILGFEIVQNTAQGIRIPHNWNLSSTDKESRIQYLGSGIHGVESRIQDCLGFTYMRQSLFSTCLLK